MDDVTLKEVLKGGVYSADGARMTGIDILWSIKIYGLD